MNQVARTLELNEADTYFHNAGYPTWVQWLTSCMIQYRVSKNTTDGNFRPRDSIGRSAIEFGFSRYVRCLCVQVYRDGRLLRHQGQLGDEKLDIAQPISKSERERN
jgi:hypothetical protein